MKTHKKWMALILLGALVLSLLAGCTDTPSNDGTPAPAPEGPQGEAQQEPGAKPETDVETGSETKNGGVLVVY